MNIEHLIDRELQYKADWYQERGYANKHELPWKEVLEEEFAVWIVNKFMEENRG